MIAIRVAAAVIERGGRLLVTRRRAGTHLAGFWEFPGGKCDDGESLDACLARELREELGVAVTVGEKILETTHRYPERQVELHFFRCVLADEPRALLGQEMKWVERRDLAALELPPADAELVGLLTADTGPTS